MPLFKRQEEAQLVKLARQFVATKQFMETLKNEIASLEERMSILNTEHIAQADGLKNLKVTMIKEMGGE